MSMTKRWLEAQLEADPDFLDNQCPDDTDYDHQGMVAPLEEIPEEQEA